MFGDTNGRKNGQEVVCVMWKYRIRAHFQSLEQSQVKSGGIHSDTAQSVAHPG